jgi:hypothetical protein
MARLRLRDTPEDRAAREAEFKAKETAKNLERERKAAAQQADREAKARAKLRTTFFASPAGQARIAFESGEQIFQFEASVKSMKAVVRSLGLGSSAIGKESWGSKLSQGPVATLNSVSNEGWELVNGSFVFVETGQSSRDKFMASGQQVATSGTVVGYYLFKRNEALKVKGTDPWDAPSAEAVQIADQIEGEPAAG